MLTCPVCPQRTFATPIALHQHQSHSKGHFYCRTCTNGFADYDALFDHAAAVHSTTCESCRRMFTTEKGVQRHFYDSPKHPKCRPCTMGFRDIAGLNAHKAGAHGTQKTLKKNSRKGRKKRPFSPTATNSDYTSTPSSSLRLWSPSTPATSQNSDADSIFHESSITSQVGDGMPTRTTSSPNLTDGSHDTDMLRYDERPQKHQASSTFPASTPGIQEASFMKAGVPTSSERWSFRTGVRDEERCLLPLRQGEDFVSRPSPEPLETRADSNERSRMHEKSISGSSTRGDARVIFSSPLLRTNITLPTDVRSDTSSDSEDTSISLHLANRRSGEPAYRRSSPQPLQDLRQGDHGDNAVAPLLWGKPTLQDSISAGTGFADAIRAACRARTTGVGRPPSPLRLNSLSSLKAVGTLPWLSQLPTIMDEQEMGQGQDIFENESGSMEEPINDTRVELQDITRLAGRRKRRLSLSPTLPSIPEAANFHEIGPASAADPCDSDSDSSQGIYEHHGQDFLYDTLSETERCQTPMTYLTADDLDLQAGEDGSFSYPPSPTLLIEDLTKLAEEVCSSSTTDGDFYDPSADPFELHPSVNNSPMSATFPKRPRAWSLSEAPYDPRFLSPARSKTESEHTEVTLENGKSDDVIGGEDEEPDEAAISADEPQPRAIEEDLFSEPDEIMEPMPHAIEAAIDSEEARFAEEGHPLRSLISLDTLPLTGKDPNLPDRTERSFPLQTDLNGGTTLGEHEAAVPGRCPLRCRICQSDPCKEATATFCGHIFCHECITREIMEKSKCPVCRAPTLLYCLFKLDLSS